LQLYNKTTIWNSSYEVYINSPLFSLAAASGEGKKPRIEKPRTKSALNYPKQHPILHQNNRIIFSLFPQVFLLFFIIIIIIVNH